MWLNSQAFVVLAKKSRQLTVGSVSVMNWIFQKGWVSPCLFDLTAMILLTLGMRKRWLGLKLCKTCSDRDAIFATSTPRFCPCSFFGKLGWQIHSNPQYWAWFLSLLHSALFLSSCVAGQFRSVWGENLSQRDKFELFHVFFFPRWGACGAP